MKNLNARSAFARLIVLAVTISVLAGQSTFAFTLTGEGRVAGEITVGGTSGSGERPFILVNGDRALSGRTLFSNDTIVTTETTTATVNLGQVGRVEVGVGSTLTLSFSENSITGTLTTGNISVANGEGVAVKIGTPDDTITNEGTSQSRFTLNVVGDKSSVVAKSGTVRYNNGASLAKQDDDDDDDEENYWVPIVIIGGAVGAVILFAVFRDDEDEIVSPTR